MYRIASSCRCLRAPRFNRTSGSIHEWALLTRLPPKRRNVQPVFDVYANVQNSDLGSVAGKIENIVQGFRKQLAPGSEIVIRGQVESMQEAFTRLGVGLGFA